MISLDQARTLAGKVLHGKGGEKLGKIDTLYADRDGGEPTFATVHTGAFGTKTSFVPLNDADLSGDTVTVPYDKELVAAAPKIDPDSELEPAEEERLYAHYGVSGISDTTTSTGTTGTTDRTDERSTTGTAGTAAAAAAGTAATAGTREHDTTATTGRTDEHGTVGHDTSGPTTDNAMTRSEERLQVGTQSVEAGRAKLRKYITTETETATVPVSRETVRVEREPITEANRGEALSGPDLSEEEHEVVLREEKPVVAKETVPVERVRLDTDTVTEDVTVNEEVRKEQIDTDGVYPDAGTRGTTETARTDETRR